MTINEIITEMSFKYEKSNIHENVVKEELQLDESCSINSMDLFETILELSKYCGPEQSISIIVETKVLDIQKLE